MCFITEVPHERNNCHIVIKTSFGGSNTFTIVETPKSSIPPTKRESRSALKFVRTKLISHREKAPSIFFDLQHDGIFSCSSKCSRVHFEARIWITRNRGTCTCLPPQLSLCSCDKHFARALVARQREVDTPSYLPIPLAAYILHAPFWYWWSDNAWEGPTKQSLQSLSDTHHMPQGPWVQGIRMVGGKQRDSVRTNIM